LYVTNISTGGDCPNVPVFYFDELNSMFKAETLNACEVLIIFNAIWEMESVDNPQDKLLRFFQWRRYTRASQGKCPGKKAFALVVALPEFLPYIKFVGI